MEGYGFRGCGLCCADGTQPLSTAAASPFPCLWVSGLMGLPSSPSYQEWGNIPGWQGQRCQGHGESCKGPGDSRLTATGQGHAEAWGSCPHLLQPIWQRQETGQRGGRVSVAANQPSAPSSPSVDWLCGPQLPASHSLGHPLPGTPGQGGGGGRGRFRPVHQSPQ